MYLSNLDVLQVRNLESVHITCHPQANIIFGANGSGKTSLLEAIYLLGRGRSFRHRDLRVVINQAATELVVAARVARGSDGKRRQLGIKRTSAGQFEARLDGASLQSSAQLVAELPLQLIDAHSCMLLEGGAQQRRQFLDWGVFHVEHGFFSAWQRFKKALLQRNAALKSKQKNSVIVMAGAAGMFPENKKFWKSALPKIKDYFDIANIHHISTPDGKCDKEFWVDEFAALLKSTNIDKPIWVTEAMTCGPPVKAYINAFLNGADVIVDVGINAPGKKMSKKGRKNLNEFISNYDGFSSLKLISKTEVEFQYKDGSKKTLKMK